MLTFKPTYGTAILAGCISGASVILAESINIKLIANIIFITINFIVLSKFVIDIEYLKSKFFSLDYFLEKIRKHGIKAFIEPFCNKEDARFYILLFLWFLTGGVVAQFLGKLF